MAHLMNGNISALLFGVVIFCQNSSIQVHASTGLNALAVDGEAVVGHASGISPYARVAVDRSGK